MIKNRIQRWVAGQVRPLFAVVVLLLALSMVAAGQTPTITSINPNPLDVNGSFVQVTISGTAISSTCNPSSSSTSLPPPAPTVYFGSVNVSSYVVNYSSTSINLRIPSSVLSPYAGTTVSVDLSVYRSGDGCFSVNSNAYPLQISQLVPSPTLNSYNPKVATVCGPPFTISAFGTNFQSNSILGFGQQQIQPYAWTPDVLPSSTMMTVTISLAQMAQVVPGTAYVEIATPSSSSPGGYLFSQQQLFTVSPTPVLQSISPSTIASGSAAFQLQATILNYVHGVTKIEWINGTSSVPLTVITETPQTGNITLVTVNVPPSLLPTPAAGSTATVQVAVVNADDANPNGTLYSSSCSPQKAFTITNAVPLQITTVAPLQEGEVGIPYQQAFTAIGGTTPYTWSMSPAVSGLTLNPQTGVLSGTPTAAAAGNITIQVNVTDAALKALRMDFPLTIYAQLAVPPPYILPAGTINTPYTQTLTTIGGKGPFKWIVAPGSSAPDGLTLATSGVLSGTPTRAASYTFAVLVTDVFGAVSGPQLSLTVNAAAPGLSITTTTVPGATLGSAYSQRLIATGGSPGYTWAVTFGQLPAGIQLDASGLLSGTPTSVGSFSFTATATDRAAATKSQAYTLTVGLPSAPTVTIRPSQTQSSTLTDQPTLALTLGASYPVDLTGTFTLSFVPSAAGLPSPYTPSDLQFASGGLSATARIAANTTTLSLPANQGIQLGSVAGTVTVTLTALSATLPGGGTPQPVPLPSPAPATSITVLPARPVITGSVIVTKTGSTITVEVTHAVSNTRDLVSATVTFHPAAGAQLTGTATFTVPLNTGTAPPSSAWFTSTAGRTAGGAFDLVIPFTYSGDTSAIGTVDVVLTNSVGGSDLISGR